MSERGDACRIKGPAQVLMAEHKDYKFPPLDPTNLAGDWRRWEEDLSVHAGSITDASGTSVFDHMQDNDMGGIGPHAIAMPIAPLIATAAVMARIQTDIDNQTRLRGARSRKLSAMIMEHLHPASRDIKAVIIKEYRSDGQAALAYLKSICDLPTTKIELKQMDTLWSELTIMKDIGMDQMSIARLHVK